MEILKNYMNKNFSKNFHWIYYIEIVKNSEIYINAQKSVF